MENLEKSEMQTMLCGIIQYCIEEYDEEDVDTIWEFVCDETDNDYDDYDSEIGVAFDSLIKEFNL
jgi:hypothetical protein